jgi:hypothetical protein
MTTATNLVASRCCITIEEMMKVSGVVTWQCLANINTVILHPNLILQPEIGFY